MERAQGSVQMHVAGPSGTYASLWNFAHGQSSVAVTGASFTDPNGQQTAMPDTAVDLRCGADVADWVGTFELQWVCLPQEHDSWRMRFSVKDASTLTIIDDDDGDTMEATIIGANAHAIRGFFIAGPVGSRYREDFTWTLSADRSQFIQTSKYVYQEGPSQGQGGICAGRARRV